VVAVVEHHGGLVLARIYRLDGIVHPGGHDGLVLVLDAGHGNAADGGEEAGQVHEVEEVVVDEDHLATVARIGHTSSGIDERRTRLRRHTSSTSCSRGSYPMNTWNGSSTAGSSGFGCGGAGMARRLGCGGSTWWDGTEER
jgi:hypothetical protein